MGTSELGGRWFELLTPTLELLGRSPEVEGGLTNCSFAVLTCGGVAWNCDAAGKSSPTVVPKWEGGFLGGRGAFEVGG
ncbi:MAG: hypothetical protein HC767_07945 [Akkermansiaceae bacterium]|nr:hypothetical protein [Akkermansiaceae bacterium]